MESQRGCCARVPIYKGMFDMSDDNEAGWEEAYYRESTDNEAKWRAEFEAFYATDLSKIYTTSTIERDIFDRYKYMNIDTSWDAYLAACRARHTEAEKTWRCFHCGFATSDRAEAEFHFGEEEGQFSVCLKWSAMKDDERFVAYKDAECALEREREMYHAEAEALRAKLVIDVEKLLCAALGREWSASGISIESLIEALREENERLTNLNALLDRNIKGCLKKNHEHCVGKAEAELKVIQLEMEVNKLRAENKRLREALEPFATADANCAAVGIRPEDTYLWKPQSNTREMRGIHMGHILAARDALANKTGEPK